LNSYYQDDPSDIDTSTDTLFASLVSDLIKDGYSVQTNALPPALIDMLYTHLIKLPQYKFNEASVGRESKQHINEKVRNDKTVWIYADSPAGIEWLKWTQTLQSYLNRQLFMGLFSFESHFAHYAKGNYYKKHFDAFKGQANRTLSLVTYLNPDWRDSDGGELVIYPPSETNEGIIVMPNYGTLVLFLSEEFEHEVKPARSDRYSIAGWFRTNSSNSARADLPS
jgi:SM-20-related protein